MLRALQPGVRLELLLMAHAALHRARQLAALQHQADEWASEWAAQPAQAYDLATRSQVSASSSATEEEQPDVSSGERALVH